MIKKLSKLMQIKIPAIILMILIILINIVQIVNVSSQSQCAPESFANHAEKLLPSVVNISTTQMVSQGQGPYFNFPPGSPFEDLFKDFMYRNNNHDQKHRATTLGSGFIISQDGYIVTNNHIIDGADKITVRLHNGKIFAAILIGTDPKTDLALLKINTSSNLVFVQWGNSDNARIGDWAMAIGNPFGLGGSVTTGIISARNRDINQGPYDDFIQTDASINRGNSGGPLFNLNGKVIGINSAIYSPSGGSVGIGFAIPSSIASSVIQQLKKYGHTRRGWLGVHIQTVTEEIGDSLGLEHPKGAMVAGVSDDSPAEKAKIQKGDVILEFNHKMVINMRSLPKIVAETEIGKNVDVVLWHNGYQKIVSVKLGELQEKIISSSNITQHKQSLENFAQAEIKNLGIHIANINKELCIRYKISSRKKCVVITKVNSNGYAAKEGIRPGDLILEVAYKSVLNVKDIIDQIHIAKKNQQNTILMFIKTSSGGRYFGLRLH